ncbi:PREDICTED: uncharacterized protein LOC109147325 [Ipomoea nil]|uniref:uncharacterized protein LOC109147325 n=1 Tax=Ipomoea nil TaxID=35883 RepID=UPI0009019319|nr:PREDICTED: uncharacterized protein LOC109147325 [Ipomoea nil]
METKVPRIHAERIRVTLGYEGLFYVDNDGLSGGMALLWRKNNMVRLLSYSQSHIDVEISLFNKLWRMTCIYGIPERGRREETWDLLGTLKTRSLLSWVVIGDFNNLLYQHEKKGGNQYPNSLLRGFGDAVDDCGLMQMPMRGHQYTWQKGKGTPNWIEERLDKALITNDWGLLNDNAWLENIRTRASDHSILFLSINAICMPRRRGPQKFRFEMAWLLDEGCKEVVETAWQEGRTEGLLHCQQLCGEKLMRWGGDQFHKFGKRINHLQRRQDAIRNRRDLEALAEYQQIENTMKRVEAQEEVFWRQRAKQHWLRGADANTKFYHRYASARRKKNFISSIKYGAGNWVEGDDMHAAIQNYFENIFASNGLSCDDPLFGVLTPRVTLEQNMMLDRPFETNEVKEALFSMYPDKAPGLDGLNPGFYQQFWEIVGGDVSGFIMNALNSCVFPEGLNDTNIVLIPKKEMPKTVADLRPIALSNVIYRIMAKMVANRMKTLMGGLISESQSAFIPGRLITDNILVAAEAGHYLNRKQCGIVGWSALKLDMSKAYDRMEWSFLERMLTVMGFSEKWIKLIMMCVTTVNYTVMVNGVAGARKSNQGTQAGRPALSEAEVIRQCLARYEKLSGQVVNYNKSNICFSRNTQEAHRAQVANCLEVEQAPNFGKYLGLPSFVGRNKRAVFSYVEEKIRQRIGSWSKKLLSQAVEEKGEYIGRHGMCIPKKYGGMGFKELRAFNLAMLGKQAWRFLTDPETLVAKIYKARYYPTTSFTDATIGNCPSYCWRSIMAAHAMVISGVRRRIGNGQTTLIWGHPWLRDNPSPLIQTEMPQQLREARVAGLIDLQTHTWDPHILSDLFIPEDVERINMIPVSPEYEDSWVEVDPTCSMCGLEHEDGLHALVLCEYSRLVWNITQLPIVNIVADSFTAWLKGAMAALTEEQTRLMIAVLYYIWRTRNSAVWKGSMMRPTQLVRAATGALQAYGAAHVRRTKPAPATDHLNGPGEDGLRCYVDAGFRHDTGEATYGMIIIAPDGSFVAARNGKLPICFSPLMAEAQAYKEALSWLLERGNTSAD